MEATAPLEQLTSVALHAQIKQAVRRGWRVESQTASQVVLVKGHRPNHILHLLLSVVTVGIWIPIWLIVAVTSREKRRVVTA